MGGLAARIAALAGIDPDSPDQPVPQPGGLPHFCLPPSDSLEAKFRSARTWLSGEILWHCHSAIPCNCSDNPKKRFDTSGKSGAYQYYREN